MKKILAIVLAALMLFTLAACGGNKTTDGNATDGNATDGNVTVDVADATELLSAIFASYAEEKKFALSGGDEANMSMEGPAKYDVALTEELTVVAHLPASQYESIEEAANVMNMMNANSFTGAAYLLKADADAAAFAADFKSELDNAHWMCGFPEKYAVITVGNYIITAYGLADNIEYFKTQATTVYEAAEIILEGDIVA